MYYENQRQNGQSPAPRRDYGPQPFAVNIASATGRNTNYRTALWTGEYLQVTLMSIPAGGDIGLEMHPDTDQFLRVEQGWGDVRMGPAQGNLPFRKKVSAGDAVMVPAGAWHNVVNVGNVPLKLYSIYAPPHHPAGTVHRTKADAQAAETGKGTGKGTGGGRTASGDGRRG